MAADLLDMNRKRLERLPPKQLARELMRLPAKRRLELILDRADAEAAVAAMDVNDFFFSVQELGPDDALPLLALAGAGQITHLFDMEWWRKDAVEPARALTWLDRLDRAGGQKLLEWLFHVDFELLVTLFKHWVQAAAAPDDVDLLEARDSLPKLTLDDVYFFEVRFPQYEDLITRMLSLMFEVNYAFYKELMSHILFVPDTEMEEQAHHFHRARLEENAIPDYYSALEIYRAITPGQMHLKEAAGPREEEEAPAPPSFALALAPGEDLLSRAIRGIHDPALLDMLQFELASLANKVVVADQIPADNAEALRQGARKAAAYVNMGLEILTGASPERASGALGEVYCEHLFRLAQERVSRIRGKVQAVLRSGWLSNRQAGLSVLDRDWFEAAEILLAKTPKIAPAAAVQADQAGAPPGEDFFRTPQDLARGNRIADVILAAGCLFEALSADLNRLGSCLWPLGQVSTTEEVTLGVMVLTAAAQRLWRGEWKVEPLPVKSWPEIFPLVRPAAMDEAVMDWLFQCCRPQGQALVEEYLTPVLRDYEEEMLPFSPEKPPDPKLVKSLMFSEG